MENSLKKSQNVLKQKRKNCQTKILHKKDAFVYKKTNTFTIASNFVREQLILFYSY